MPRPVKARRAYRSPRRRAQAEATRRAILESARALFVTRGYAGTTIEAIAGEADVAPETVYASFGSKRALLRRLLDIAVAGDERPIPLQERPWVGELRREPDPRRRARILARETRPILERSAGLLMALRDAASADPELAETWAEVNRLMLEDHAAFARALARGGALRAGLTPGGAADLIWALASPEVYDRLVRRRGWSPERFEAWLADAIERLLLR